MLSLAPSFTGTVKIPIVAGATTAAGNLAIEGTSSLSPTSGGGITFGGNATTQYAEFINSGFFGVGTTSPWAQLSVSTTSSAFPNSPLFAVGSSTNTAIFDVFGNGNVGIGTTSPSSALSVNGNGYFTGSLTLGTALSIANGGTGTSTGGYINGVVYNNGTYHTTNANFTFNGSVLSAPNIIDTGISANSIPYINGSQQFAALTLGSGITLTNGTLSTYFTNSGSNTYLNTGLNLQAPTFAATSTTGTSTITNALSVGNYLLVSPTTPTYGYMTNDIVDAGQSVNDFSAVNSFNNSAGACATADFAANNNIGSASTGFFDLGQTSSNFTGIGCINNPFPAFAPDSGYLMEPNGNQYFAIGSTSATSYFTWLGGGYSSPNRLMTLQENGNLGIGTTSPWGQLSVNPNALAAGIPSFVVGSSTNTNFIVANTGAVGVSTSSPWARFAVEMGTVFANTFAVSNQGSSTPGFVVQGVNGNGRVGIATSSPWGQLSVDTSTLSGSPALAIGSSAGSLFNVLSNGNVGVGTTTPGALFAVNGDEYFTGNLTVGTSVTSPTINGTTALQLNGANINTAGTLSNVAYLNQAQTFTALNQFANASTSQLTATSSVYLATL